MEPDRIRVLISCGSGFHNTDTYLDRYGNKGNAKVDDISNLKISGVKGRISR